MNEQVWRCYCHDDGSPFFFEGKSSECPNCKARAQPVARIHYLVVDDAGPIKTMIGNRRRACAPLARTAGTHASGERLAVTCPQCVASEVFKRHQAEGVDQHVPLVEEDPRLRKQVEDWAAKTREKGG
jgi:hypothetical protein